MNEHIKSIKLYFDEDLVRDNKIYEFLNVNKNWIRWVDHKYPYPELTKEIFDKISSVNLDENFVLEIIDLIKAYHNPSKFKNRKAGVLFTLRKHSLQDINNRNWKWCSRWGLWDEKHNPKEYGLKISLLRERNKYTEYSLMKCEGKPMLETIEVWVEIDEFMYNYLSKEKMICEDNFIIKI